MLEQQAWVSLLGFAGFGLALMGYLAHMKRDLKADISGLRSELKAEISDTRSELKAEISGLRSELKSEISDTRSELKADIGRIDSRLITLEGRTYDISARLPPAPASTSSHPH